jgi:hypothetical protein
MTQTKRLEQQAFEVFARIHPHEAYTAYPDRFWKFFKKQYPGLTHQDMLNLLKETEGEKKQ